MRYFDLFVLPSLREGISNTILEAMASGLPVVATRVGGNPELVDEGTTGTLVPCQDPIAIAKAISAYLNDHSMLNDHGRNGRKRIEERFGLEPMINRYLAVYDDVLNGGRRVENACLQSQPQDQAQQ
jgi:glycosyltransferase involved in cell wall biosynthesis